LSILAYASSWGLAFVTNILTFSDPAIPIAWLSLAVAIAFWSAAAIGLSALACVAIQIGIWLSESRSPQP